MSTAIKTSPRASLGLALFALLTGSSLLAGAIGGAVSATTGTVNQVGLSTVGAVHSTVNGTVTGSVSAPGASGSSAASVNAAYGTPNANANLAANTNVAAAGTDYDTIGMREERLQMRADAAASTDVQAIGQVVSSVRMTAYADREKIDSSVSNSLEETKKALAKDEAQVSTAARADYASARAEVRAREASLADSLKAAHAAAKDQWAAARDDVAVSYSLYATAVMRSRVIAAQGSASASASLDSAATVATIRSSDRAAREQLSDDIRTKLAATDKALDAARNESKRLGADAKESYLTAIRVAAHREREVKHTLSSAAKASESEWAQARNDVAVAYADYAEAVSRAELAATARGTAEVAANSPQMQAASNGTLVASEHN